MAPTESSINAEIVEQARKKMTWFATSFMEVEQLHCKL